MSKPIVWGKKEKKYFKVLSAEFVQRVLKVILMTLNIRMYRPEQTV